MLPENENTQSSNHSQLRYTLEERKKYIEKWQASKLSRTQFCRREGLKLPTFCHWLKAINLKQKSKPAMSFISMGSAHSHLSATEPCVEVVLPNGVQCCFKQYADANLLIQIVKGLSHVVSD